MCGVGEVWGPQIEMKYRISKTQFAITAHCPKVILHLL